MAYIGMAHTDIDRLRRRLVDAALLIIAVILPLLAALSFVRVPQTGLLPVNIATVLAALVVIGLYIARRRIGSELKALVLALISVGVAIQSYSAFGEAARVIVILMLSVLVVSVAVERRTAYLYALLAGLLPVGLVLSNFGPKSQGQSLSQLAPLVALGVFCYLLTAYLIADKLIRYLKETAEREYQIERTDFVSGGLNELALRERIDELMASSEAPVVRLYQLYLPELDVGNSSYSRDLREQFSVRLSASLNVHLPSNTVVGRLNTGSFVIVAKRSDWAGVEAALRTLRKTEFNIHEMKLLFDPVVVTTDAPADGKSAQHLLDNLARVLQRARRNRLEFARYLPIDNSLMDNEYLFVGELDQAMKSGDLQLFLQAKVSTAETNPIVGAEALVRWNHPSQGLLSPGAFLQQIENSNARTNFALFIIRESAELLQQFQAISADFELSFNLNAYDLQELRVLAELQRVMEEYKFAKGTLQIEVSESETTVHIDALTRAIAALRELGYSSSLDDFGTGMCSLAYFSVIPVDTVKVDRSFLSAIETSEVGRTVLKSIVELCKGVGCTAVVEGVETQSQADIVTQLGFDRIQGFYYGKPLEVTHFKTILEQQQAKVKLRNE